MLRSILCPVLLLAANLLHAQYKITAHVSGFPQNQTFYLKDLDTDMVIESAKSRNNSFSMKGNLDDSPRTLWLYTYVKTKFYYCNLFIGNETITVAAKASEMPYFVGITGSKHQDVQNILNRSIATISSQRDSRKENQTVERWPFMEQRPALLLLDVQLQGATSFDLLLKLGQTNFEVVFITTHDQYAIRAIKFSALDYLLKPVTVEELQAAVTKVAIRLQEKQKDDKLLNLLSFIASDSRVQQKIALPMQNETRYEPIHSIVRLEASSNYCYVMLESGEKLLVSRTLKEFAGMLESYGFVRAHQTHLVNTRFVKSYLKEDGGTLLLNDKMKIPVSRAHRVGVKERLKG